METANRKKQQRSKRNENFGQGYAELERTMKGLGTGRKKGLSFLEKKGKKKKKRKKGRQRPVRGWAKGRTLSKVETRKGKKLGEKGKEHRHVVPGGKQHSQKAQESKLRTSRKKAKRWSAKQMEGGPQNLRGSIKLPEEEPILGVLKRNARAGNPNHFIFAGQGEVSASERSRGGKGRKKGKPERGLGEFFPPVTALKQKMGKKSGPGKGSN